jgi:hypothetical protein
MSHRVSRNAGRMNSIAKRIMRPPLGTEGVAADLHTASVESKIDIQRDLECRCHILTEYCSCSMSHSAMCTEFCHAEAVCQQEQGFVCVEHRQTSGGGERKTDS